MLPYEIAFAKAYRFFSMALPESPMTEQEMQDICQRFLYDPMAEMGLGKDSALNLLTYFFDGKITIFPYILHDIASVYVGTKNSIEDLDAAFKRFRTKNSIAFGTTGKNQHDFAVFARRDDGTLVGTYPVPVLCYGFNLKTYKGGQTLKKLLSSPLSQLTDDGIKALRNAYRLHMINDKDVQIQCDVELPTGKPDTVNVVTETIPPSFILGEIINMPQSLLKSEGSPYQIMAQYEPWTSNSKIQQYLSTLGITTSDAPVPAPVPVSTPTTTVYKNVNELSDDDREELRNGSIEYLCASGYSREDAEVLADQENTEIYHGYGDMFAALINDYNVNPNITLQQAVDWFDGPENAPKPEPIEPPKVDAVQQTLDLIDKSAVIDPAVKEYLLHTVGHEALSNGDKTIEMPRTPNKEIAKDYLYTLGLPNDVLKAIELSIDSGEPVKMPEPSIKDIIDKTSYPEEVKQALLTNSPIPQPKLDNMLTQLHTNEGDPYPLEDPLYDSARVMLYEVRKGIVANPSYANAGKYVQVLYSFLRALMAIPADIDDVKQFIEKKTTGEDATPEATEVINKGLEKL